MTTTATPATAQAVDVHRPIDWDDPNWGKPGFNVHHGSTDELGGPNDREQVADQ